MPKPRQQMRTPLREVDDARRQSARVQAQAQHVDRRLEQFGRDAFEQWRHGTVERPISFAGRKSVLYSVVGGIATTLVYGQLLHIFTNAYSPFADSLVLSFSVVGQLLMMNRRVENWPFWLLAMA